MTVSAAELLGWYDVARRDLPWREPGVTRPGATPGARRDACRAREVWIRCWTMFLPRNGMNLAMQVGRFSVKVPSCPQACCLTVTGAPSLRAPHT
jgi:transposase